MLIKLFPKLFTLVPLLFSAVSCSNYQEHAANNIRDALNSIPEEDILKFYYNVKETYFIDDQSSDNSTYIPFEELPVSLKHLKASGAIIQDTDEGFSILLINTFERHVGVRISDKNLETISSKVSANKIVPYNEYIQIEFH